MRPTTLVADSQEGFLDAARQLINKAKAISDNIKSIRIIEDVSSLNAGDGKVHLKAHILKRS